MQENLFDVEFENILLDQHGRLGVLTLNRPGALNALNTETFREIAEALDLVMENATIEALIVTGQGDKAFAAGADISELAQLDSAFAARDLSLAGQDVFQTLSTLPIPTVAVINGYALGGGLELALAADVRVAHPRAKLGLPEVTLGLIPGYGGTQRLPRLIGVGRALDLMLSGRQVDAQEALGMGLVNYVEEAPLEFAREYLSRLLDRGGPMAFGLIKEAVRRGMDTSLSDALEIEADMFGMVLATQDAKEGTRAFLEKRKANFKGE
ncbi:enoyl-CoA hydratase [Deinobacterium chartae]|uniref:Enoyl-CoA hydratase n=1 Tax=Deinobacterium chartae TaxID=521158 RepID=A0A841HYB4_9DEIO|nr:enoyl-CoA hydratase-related protein [Deinobacterium chartae]MBB6097644.1 enoyl-CoA hydratase [Deinobacterium chartae]